MEKNVKISAIGTIGDIIGAFGSDSMESLLEIQRMLADGASAAATMPRYSIDDSEYVSGLRESILETWTFIIQMAFSAKHRELIVNIAPQVISLVHSVAEDDESSESAVRASIGALG